MKVAFSRVWLKRVGGKGVVLEAKNEYVSDGKELSYSFALSIICNRSAPSLQACILQEVYRDFSSSQRTSPLVSSWPALRDKLNKWLTNMPTILRKVMFC